MNYATGFPFLVLLWLFTPVVYLFSIYGVDRAMPRMRLLLCSLITVWMSVVSVILFTFVVLLMGKLKSGEAGRFAFNLFVMILPLTVLIAFAARVWLREKVLGLYFVLRCWAGSVPWDRIRGFVLALGRLVWQWVGQPLWRLVKPLLKSSLFWFIWYKAAIVASLGGVTLAIADICVGFSVDTPSFFVRAGLAPPAAQALAGLTAIVCFVATMVAFWFCFLKPWVSYLFRSYEAYEAMLAGYEATTAKINDG
jgi:hypothetical protein